MGGDLWGRMEEKETPASRRMCSSRQTRTGRCWERTVSRASFVCYAFASRFVYIFVSPFALEFTGRNPVQCRCFEDIYLHFFLGGGNFSLKKCLFCFIYSI